MSNTHKASKFEMNKGGYKGGDGVVDNAQTDSLSRHNKVVSIRWVVHQSRGD